MENIIKRAMTTGQPVIIMYLSKKGMITKRVVSVETLSVEWLGGFCHLRQAFRRFHRANILAVFPASANDLIRNVY